MIHYFIFNGQSSLDYGIVVKTAFGFVRPEERVESVEIVGRTGALTLTQGEDIYKPYNVKVSIGIPSERVSDVFRWLRGSGYLTLSNNSNMMQEARVVKSFSLEKVSRNIQYYNTDIEFMCQPYKVPLREAEVDLFEQNDYEYTGDVETMPVFYLDAGNSDFSIAIGDEALNVSGSAAAPLTDSEGWMVDTLNCEVAVVNLGTYAITRLETALASGTFPRLKRGHNTITIGGDDVMQSWMKPNTRYL